jgi:Retrotransposon gag protein
MERTPPRNSKARYMGPVARRATVSASPAPEHAPSHNSPSDNSVIELPMEEAMGLFEQQPRLPSQHHSPLAGPSRWTRWDQQAAANSPAPRHSMIRSPVQTMSPLRLESPELIVDNTRRAPPRAASAVRSNPFATFPLPELFPAPAPPPPPPMALTPVMVQALVQALTPGGAPAPLFPPFAPAPPAVAAPAPPVVAPQVLNLPVWAPIPQRMASAPAMVRHWAPNPFHAPLPQPPPVPPAPIMPAHFIPAVIPPFVPPPPQAPPQVDQLAHAISLLVQTLQYQHAQAQARAQIVPPIAAPAPAPAYQGGRAKVREPDPFDGTATFKLRPFLVQCQLNFKDRPAAFPRDEQKVTYALSYLKGNALAWFEPFIIEEDIGLGVPTFFTDYVEFCTILRNNFGPTDPAGAAQNDILSLSMKESQHISTYIVNFMRLSSQLGFNEEALSCLFYHGLPERIKDQIALTDKPVTYDGLRALVQNIDSRYWRRKAEISRNHPRASTSTSTPTSARTPSTSTKPSEPSKPTAPKSAPPATKSADLASKLGPDGKLSPAEKKRRMDNNLCLFCGEPGHRANACPKSTSSATKAKGRSAEITEVPSDAEDPADDTPA